MATPITTGAHPKLLWPGLKAIWGYSYADWPAEWMDLVDIVSSDKAYEEYQQVTMFGLPYVKGQGDAVRQDTEQGGPATRITNISFGLGYEVTMEELQDDQYQEIAGNRAKALGRSMNIGKEYFVAGLYNNAFTAGVVGGDGVTLASAAHPMVGGGTQSNVPTAPTDLSEASIEDAVISIMGLTDDRGLNIHLQPESLHVSRFEYFNAHRILDSDYQNDSGNNAVNVLKQQGIFPKGIKANVYFTNARPWFIRTNVDSGKGLIFQQRMKASFDRDNAFDTKSIKATTVERYAVGWADFRAVFAVNAP